MKKLIFSSLFFIFLLGTTSAQFLTGSGSDVTKSLSVDDFHSLALSVNGEINLKQGNSTSVEVTGQQNIIDNLNLEVKDGKWRIKFKKKMVRNYHKLKFNITMKEVESIAVSGSGDIIGKSNIKADDLNVSVSGSGDIDLDVDADDISSAISGSGDISLAGSASSFSIAISGSGDVQASNLASEDVSVRVSGSGDVSVHATGTLNVSMSGSGDVSYKGSPKVQSRVSGSGDVKAI
jgi:hypothetical protein